MLYGLFFSCLLSLAKGTHPSPILENRLYRCAFHNALAPEAASPASPAGQPLSLGSRGDQAEPSPSFLRQSRRPLPQAPAKLATGRPDRRQLPRCALAPPAHRPPSRNEMQRKTYKGPIISAPICPHKHYAPAASGRRCENQRHCILRLKGFGSLSFMR